jgi:hypothetical protein
LIGDIEIAGKFAEAAKIYADHPAALQLRAMNKLFRPPVPSWFEFTT